MPSNWLYMDTNFPTFTGEESTGEKISTIQNYLFLLVEQMRYTLGNLDLSNMNTTAVDRFVEEITGPIYARIEDEEGHLARLELTAQGLSASISNAQDDIVQMELEADGIWAAVEDLETAAATMVKVDSSGVYITDAEGNILTLSGKQLDVNTVTATNLVGDYVYLRNYLDTIIGTIGITGATTADYAIDLNSQGALRLQAERGGVYIASYTNYDWDGDGAVDPNATLYLGKVWDNPLMPTQVWPVVQMQDVDYFYPTTAQTNLGWASRGIWGTLYTADSPVVSSDRNAKYDIEDLPQKYVDFALWLSARRFKLKRGTSGRYHPGFVAQEVEEGLALFDIDTQEFGGFVKDKDEDGNDIYMLRYEEFIAIILKAVQSHEERLKRLEGTE